MTTLFSSIEVAVGETKMVINPENRFDNVHSAILKSEKFPHGKDTPSRVIESSKDFSYEKAALTNPQTINSALQNKLEELFHQLNTGLLGPHLRDGKGFRCGPAPECILGIEYQLKRYRGFAAKEAWSDQHGRKLDQITMVFDRGASFDLNGFASTLVHEMIHATQFANNTQGTNNYHNADFRDRMKSVGLQTSKTGKPGDPDIGTGMSHYIISNGPFDRFMVDLIGQGFSFPCEVTRPTPQPTTLNSKRSLSKTDPSKTKFYCSKCGQIARANYSAQLKCGRVRCKSSRMIVEY